MGGGAEYTSHSDEAYAKRPCCDGLVKCEYCPKEDRDAKVQTIEIYSHCDAVLTFVNEHGQSITCGYVHLGRGSTKRQHKDMI